MTSSTPDAISNDAAAQVRAAVDQYFTWFAAGRADLIAAQSYLAPFLVLRPEGPVALPTPDAVQAALQATIAPLLADGYARTEMPAPTVTVLGPTAAILSGSYTRYRKDGSAMGTYGGTYLLARTPGGWRIAVAVVHAPDIRVSAAATA